MAASLFKWFYLILLGLPVGRYGANAPHPLYISVLEINHNAKEKTLEISCKIFTSDLEIVLEKLAHGKVDLSDAASKKATDKWIADYVAQHLQLTVDGRVVSYHFAGSEKEADGTWSYFQAEGVASVKKLGITNSILYDRFSQEINIMHVTVGGEKKSTRLNYPDRQVDLQF